MANKGVIDIYVKPYTYECGDGCCTEHGYDVTIALNGTCVLDRRYVWDYEEVFVEEALEALGYTVNIHE